MLGCETRFSTSAVGYWDKIISHVFGDSSQEIAKIPLSLHHRKSFTKK